MNTNAQSMPVQWWNGGNALRTRLFDALSLLIPSGETFLIETVGEWLASSPGNSSDPLRCEAERFVKEEQSHQRAHRLYNQRLAQHAPAAQLEAGVVAMLQELHDWSRVNRFAMAAGIEHATTLLSEEVLRERSVWLADGTTSEFKLWRWHCKEELEHRYVAADVAQAAGVGLWRRRLMQLVAFGYLTTDTCRLIWTLCRCDVRAGRSSILRLVVQATGFMLHATPSLVRMGLRAWQIDTCNSKKDFAY